MCVRLALSLLLLGLAVPTGSTAAPAGGCTKAAPPKLGERHASKPAAKLPAGATYRVTFRTNCGTFTVTLDQKQSPNTVASFVSLVKKGFFNRTIFHRIVPGFVIQGGDPTGTGTGGPGYTTVDKPPKSAAYTHGVVAMAKTASEPAGAAGSQFFVVTEANAQLPPDYAIIGKVTKGLAVVDLIGKLGNASQLPTRLIEIEKATVSSS